MERYPTPDLDEPAGVLDRRVEALLVDGIVVAVVTGILGYVLGSLLVGGALGGIGGAYLTLQFGTPILFLGYQTVFEGYYGQTLGKRERDIVVVRPDGSDVTWSGAVLRNLLRLIDLLPAFYVVGILVAYATENHQRIGDLAGNTVVVHTGPADDEQLRGRR